MAADSPQEAVVAAVEVSIQHGFPYGPATARVYPGHCGYQGPDDQVWECDLSDLDVCRNIAAQIG